MNLKWFILFSKKKAISLFRWHINRDFYLNLQRKNNIMVKGVLTLVPSGGLANRMRAVASAYSLCLAVGSRLRVVWFRDWALNATFSDIFEPPGCPGVELCEATWADLLVNDRPRRRNLWLPALPQRLLYCRRIGEREVTPLKLRGFDFEAWARGRRCWMSCYQEFGSCPDEVYRRLFRPVDDVMRRVSANVERFGGRTIGMHIRRTDHGEATALSPTRLFIEAGRREAEAHHDLTIFLATDDEGVKRELRDAFGGRVVTAAGPASRGSADGIRGGLADMYTLARTARIYASAGSSFSPMAARIGGVPLTELRTDGDGK